MKVNIALVAMVVAAGLLSGCATSGGSDKLNSQAQKTSDNLNTLKAQVTDVMASIDQMNAADAPLQEIYTSYCKQVKQLNKSADALKKKSLAMKTAGADKFEAWKLETEQIQDDKMRKDSIDLMEDAIKEHEKLLKLLGKSETLMDPLVTDLNDIEKFLELELSQKSVKKISGKMRAAGKEGSKVIEWIDDVQEELAAIGK